MDNNSKKKIKYVKINDEDYKRSSSRTIDKETAVKRREAAMSPESREEAAKRAKEERRLDRMYDPRRLTTGQKIRKSLAVIGTTLVSLLLILVITVCLVATAMTVYIMQFADSSFDVDLEDVELSYSSFLMAYDENGQEVQLKQLSTDENRVWTDIEEMPQHLLDAVIATEDERFLDHDGVDWKRTFGVTLAAVVSGGTDGGSTITQQLVRDITGDKETTIGRKLREIFRALSLENKYTKLDILESYLNRISFGGTAYGIGSAAYRYFGKEVSELTIAESAILAGLIRSPSNYNPYSNLKQSKTRQEYALSHMYDQGYISTSEYEAAIAEKVQFRLPVKGDDYGYVDERYDEWYGISDETEDDPYYQNVPWEDIISTEDGAYEWSEYEITQDWYTDAAINQVVEDLAELYDISYESARTKFYSGGYTAYLNVDMKYQKILSEKFADPLTCVSFYDEAAESKDLLQAAFVLMDYRGRVLAIAGGLGDKPGDNCFNRATQAVSACGSSIKPLSVYSLAVDRGIITYSTMQRNLSGKIHVDVAGDEEGKFTATMGYDEEDQTVRWPHNYKELGFGDGLMYPSWYAVQKSTNTIAISTLHMIGLQEAYNQLVTKLGFSHLSSTNDVAYSPLGLGAFTNGVTLTELAAAYQIMGNGGTYYEPYYYSRVEDINGNIILEQNNVGTQAISKSSAWVTNRMMLKVIEDPYGSGINAKLENVEVVGKTGTANDMSNLVFCGLTPQFVGAYRIAYDDNHEIKDASVAGWRTLARVWHDVMIDIVDTSVEQSFTPDSGTLTLNYCTETGLHATSRCPETAVGYYTPDNIPKSCDSKHDGEYWNEIFKDVELTIYE